MPDVAQNAVISIALKVGDNILYVVMAPIIAS